MSFVNTISGGGPDISESNGVWTTINDLTDTALDTGGIDIDESISSFTNNNIIFGGGGGGGNSGTNALEINSGINITALINLGSFCGGGGGGGLYSGGGGPGNGGAGGGGGGGGFATTEPSGNGGNGNSGTGGNGGAGGGGGFNGNGGSGHSIIGIGPATTYIGGTGSLSGGGGGGSYISVGYSANYYGGGGGGSYCGGGGAGGGYGGGGGVYSGGGGGAGGGIGGVGEGIVGTVGGNGGYSILNNGTIQTLENQQGIGYGLGALFYSGALPFNYNIIIQSNELYGQLFFTGFNNISAGVPVPGPLSNFGISTVHGTIIPGSYDAVLVNITPDNTSGIIQGFNWTLQFVAANTTNCKGQQVIIGGIAYDSYDLIITTPYPCFKEGSKILTDKGYTLVQDLRKGDLVKTLNHGFKPIEFLGKREIQHYVCKERIKDQLYCCSKDNFKEVFEEPLVITGCHSILVDEFINEEQRAKTKEVNGDIYVTENKYRLPACVDLRTSVYPVPGTYMIYHLALENDNYYNNYGIYANGLLVETCSKRYLKELSGMELII